MLRNIISSLQQYADELHRDRYPYLRPDLQMFGLKWSVQQGGFGCRPVSGQATIQMVKNPPPIPGVAPPPPPPPPPAPAQAPSPQAASPAAAPSPKGGGTSSTSPAAQQAGNQGSAQQCPTLAPFDMLDLPGAMKAVGFKYAAYCADRWFKGKAHIIPDKSAAIQSNDFVDKDTFKLSWILSVGKVRERFDHLSDPSEANQPQNPESIYNANARSELVRRFSQYMADHGNTCSGPVDLLAYCGGDIQKLHRDFQFQRSSVSMEHVLGGYSKIIPNDILGKEVMNDLAASLANFNFYAAAAHATVTTSSRMWYDTAPWRIGFKTKVQISHIYIYAKDVYSFNDERRDSQYLGHWNRYGVIIAYDAFAYQAISKMAPEKFNFELGNDPRPYWPHPPTHLDKPVDIGSKFTERQVFYPVRNRDFNDWRHIKKRGGDFAIYSDLRKIRLPQPIIIELPEIFRDYKK